jgi:hypothetical protein
MAIYVYNTSTGHLYSYCPNDSDPVADAATLAASGLAMKPGLPPLDDTHGWDETSRSVIAITPPKSAPDLKGFWQRFTVAEREAIENLAATGTQANKNKLAAFFRYVQSAGMVDCNDSYILSSVQLLETAGVIGAGRTAQIVV